MTSDRDFWIVLGAETDWMTEHATRQHRLNRPALLIAVSVFAAWAVVVGLSGAGVSLFQVGWDFGLTGELGDSFGVIGAIMASVAAYFAFQTYTLQREETRLLRQERYDAAKLRAEPSFLNLLERRYDALDQLLFSFGSLSLKGHGAVEQLARAIASDLPREGDVLLAYDKHIKNTRGHEHLFRFIYHIIRYAEYHFDGVNDDTHVVTRDTLSYRYVRLLRSQLSDSELFILALNVLTPEGAGAKKLYERYALFHNLSHARKQVVMTAGAWDKSAFGLPE